MNDLKCWRVERRDGRAFVRGVNYKGYAHHASEDEPQYAIQSDKTDPIALHKGKALRHLPR